MSWRTLMLIGIVLAEIINTQDAFCQGCFRPPPTTTTTSTPAHITTPIPSAHPTMTTTTRRTTTSAPTTPTTHPHTTSITTITQVHAPSTTTYTTPTTSNPIPTTSTPARTTTTFTTPTTSATAHTTTSPTTPMIPTPVVFRASTITTTNSTVTHSNSSITEPNTPTPQPTTATTPTTSRPSENCTTYEYLKVREGFNLTGYHPTAQSGVTIATGVDLGQQSAAGLTALGIDTTIIQKLTPYLGLKTKAAVTAKGLTASNLVLTAKEAEQLDKPFLDKLKEKTKAYGTKMTCKGKAVLVSLRHWAGSLGNSKGQGKLSVKVGTGTRNFVWDAINGKTATDAQLKAALEATLPYHTRGTAGYNRIQAEINHLSD